MDRYRAYTEFENGAVRLYVNGEVVAPVIYGLSDIPASDSDTPQAQKNIRNFGCAGINLVQVDTEIRQGWKENGDFDILPIAYEVKGAVDANPDAAVIIRLHMNPPYWWIMQNPDEWVVYYGFDTEDNGEQVRLIGGDNENRPRISFASEKWLSEAGEMLKKICELLPHTEAGKHVIGIQIAYGMYGEWHHFGKNPDYGKPVTKRFRRYLHEKYKTDEALQRAWGNPDVTIETAELAGAEKRNGDTVDAHLYDSLKVHQMIGPEAILHFAEIIKKNWKGEILTGVFYGYYFNISPKSYVKGHLEPHMIYDSSFIDFLAAPLAYMANRPITGSPLPRGFIESARINHKLWLTEMDQEPIGTDKQVGGLPEYRGESVAILRRNVLDNILRGAGCWYYDHRVVPDGSIFEKNGWWDEPSLMKEIEKIQAVAEECAGKEYIPMADVAVVYDTERLYKTTYNKWGEPENEYKVPHGVGHSGAMYDYIYLKDLKKADVSRYKCIVFVNMDESEIEIPVGCHALFVNEGSPEFFREEFKKAGAHIYSDKNDVVVVGFDRIMLTVTVGGKREILLRNGKRVMLHVPDKTTLLINADTGKSEL